MKMWQEGDQKIPSPFQSLVKGLFIKFDSRLCAKHGDLKMPRVTVHYCVSWKRKSRVKAKEIETGPSGECVEYSSSSNSNSSSSGGNLVPISGKKSGSFETAIARSGNFRARRADTACRYARYASRILRKEKYAVRAITSSPRTLAHPSSSYANSNCDIREAE